MKMPCLTLLCALLALCSACDEPLSHLGDQKIEVFTDQPISFRPDTDSAQTDTDQLVLHGGRIILRKLTLPVYQLQPQVTARVSLTSNGDPWDKSGSLFVLPANDTLSIISLAQGQFPPEKMAEPYPAVAHFTDLDQTYYPAVELLRFITPFGVGYYSDKPKMLKLKPVYIPNWADAVTWSADISHLLPLLENEVWVGVYIDTWSEQGYNISVDFDFKESQIAGHRKQQAVVLPLVNTNAYIERQQGYDGFAKADLTVEFDLSQAVAKARLYYVTTGHGGHSTGDEFTPRENQLSFDGIVISRFTPWRDDCANFRRLNPSSGVWTQTTQWQGETIEERIASSDYSRSNWCPGSDVPAKPFDLGPLSQGKHQLTVSIPEAQAATEDQYNGWIVSAYIVYEL
ncbi:peptide-N-glycosidase F-related protein [Pseudomonadales bacterium]|nr:peptide-N-glycosidase F-related protein [Pseudomonadales bacterium]MDB9880143.1 peptide-N-glycosidase F-related protein [Pseudomonadales bacterium]